MSQEGDFDILFEKYYVFVLFYISIENSVDQDERAPIRAL